MKVAERNSMERILKEYYPAFLRISKKPLGKKKKAVKQEITRGL